MNYYLGPFTQQTIGSLTCYAPPVGALGCIDLAPLPVQSVMADHRPVGVFWTRTAVLPSEYTLVGDGDCRELATTATMQDAFKSLVGYKPQGARLVDLVMDCLQGGSDPSGNNGPLPIVPDQSGWMDLWMPGHSKVLAERFEWGKPGSRGSNHTPKLKQLLRAQFTQLFADAQAGRLKDNQHHRRVLDAWCDKYNLQGADDWKEFVPANLQKDVPGRLKHETTFTDDFNRADGSLGASWGILSGTWSIVSQVVNQSVVNNCFARYESDLSTTDHYSQNLASVATSVGASARKDSTATLTQYMGRYAASSNRSELYKQNAGAFTLLTTDATSQAGTMTLQLKCNGSSITWSIAGTALFTVTDTSISSGLRCCLYNVSTTSQDNFQASDVASATILYTQLESTTRGMLRGTYARAGI